MEQDARPVLKWTVIYVTTDFMVRRIVVEAVSILGVGGMLEAWSIDPHQVMVIERLLEEGDGLIRQKA